MRIAVNVLFNRRLLDRVRKDMMERQSIYFCVSCRFFVVGSDTQRVCRSFLFSKSYVKGNEMKCTTMQTERRPLPGC